MELINNYLINELEKSNSKQKKDIIIIIDFNNYDKEEENNNTNLDLFINQTITILEDYLSINDRIGIIIYKTQYQIVSPLLPQNRIDIESLSKDLIYYKNNLCNKFEEDEDSSIKELNNNSLDILPIGQQNNKSDSESESQESDIRQDKQIKIEDIIKGLVDSINYSIKYLKIKEEEKKEKYIILFTDIFNTYKIDDEIIITNFNELYKEEEIIFLLVGKIKENILKNNINKLSEFLEEKKINLFINEKFGNRSEVINSENMKKIKSILTNNSDIKEEIIFPNEISK